MMRTNRRTSARKRSRRMEKNAASAQEDSVSIDKKKDERAPKKEDENEEEELRVYANARGLSRRIIRNQSRNAEEGGEEHVPDTEQCPDTKEQATRKCGFERQMALVATIKGKRLERINRKATSGSGLRKASRKRRIRRFRVRLAFEFCFALLLLSGLDSGLWYDIEAIGEKAKQKEARREEC
jgi:hypothetical protein